MDSQQFPENHTLNNKFIKAFLLEAETWVGVKYCHMGKTRKGTDCQGLIMAIYKNLGIKMPKDAYGLYVYCWHLGDPQKAERMLQKHCKPIVGSKSPSDICTFASNHPLINHFGLWLNQYEFIHATPLAGNKVMISSIKHRYWYNCFRGTYRFKFMLE